MKLLQMCALMAVLRCKKNVVFGKMEGFVVGGKSAPIDDFPHAVYLELTNNRKWICGAAVLNQDILLTAAHCLFVCVETSCTISAYAGHESLYKVSIVREIQFFKIHGNYDDVAMEFDIALAKVETSLPLGDDVHVKRVLLMHHFPVINNAFLAGWGVVNDETREAAVTLQMTTQVIQNESECSAFVEMNPGIFCAMTPSRLGTPSEGDSGSALVSPSTHQQIGLVSFRMEDNPKILFYTNVSYFHYWIEAAAEALACGYSTSKFFTL